MATSRTFYVHNSGHFNLAVTTTRRVSENSVYARSLRIRKRIEEAFGWIKTIAGLDKTKFRGRDRVGWAFTLSAAAYNLVRLLKLLGVSS